jgi:hypothetical protein
MFQPDDVNSVSTTIRKNYFRRSHWGWIIELLFYLRFIRVPDVFMTEVQYSSVLALLIIVTCEDG